ncbi:hypothetical protein FACS189493_6140 [Spirochaetia bacterium]|nr:hypothetical protein FACS189493_6140 [Spirochaetia bacterium]
MKQFVKDSLFLLGKLFSYIYPYKFHTFLVRLRDSLHSGYIAHQFNRLPINSLIRRPFYLRGGKYIRIGENTTIQKNGVLTAWDKYHENHYNPQIIIGNHVDIGEYCHITAMNKIMIGNGVLTGRWVTITDNSHGKMDKFSFELPPSERIIHSPGAVIIEDNVWIGDKVTILPNVRIGRNVVIGANSVVTKNIPKNSIAVGNPAKIVKVID